MARRAVPVQLPVELKVELDPVEAERTIVRFLRDYLAASGRKGYVVGLSGGLDSAVAAALAARAVGPENVHPLALPEDATEPVHLEDAALVAKTFRLEARTVSIQPFVDAFAKLVPGADRALLANAKARFRMVLLHAEAGQRDALVLGTGNKSEMVTGYFSKYGDGGVDLQPIGDLYKTQVRALAAHLGVPQRVIDKAPTAGLWAGQTDEAELGMAYAGLDRVLLGLELHLPVARIAETASVPATEVLRIEALRARTQHKRRMPPIPKVGIRTVGLDWRASNMEG